MESTSNRSDNRSGTGYSVQMQLDLCRREVEALRNALAVAREQAAATQGQVKALETVNEELRQRGHEVQRSYHLLEMTA